MEMDDIFKMWDSRSVSVSTFTLTGAKLSIFGNMVKRQFKKMEKEKMIHTEDQ